MKALIARLIPMFVAALSQLLFVAGSVSAASTSRSSGTIGPFRPIRWPRIQGERTSRSGGGPTVRAGGTSSCAFVSHPRTSPVNSPPFLSLPVASSPTTRQRLLRQAGNHRGMSQQDQSHPRSRLILHTRGGGSNNESDGKDLVALPKKSKLAKALTGILHGFTSAFILVNYFYGPTPANVLLNTPRRVWMLVHAVCSMLFAGTIVVSTVVEGLVLASRLPVVWKFWFVNVPALDSAIVLPALTGSMISGVAQACQTYGSFREAPKHVIGTLHGLVAFAVWWAATDKTTQKKAKQAVAEITQKSGSSGAQIQVEQVPGVLYRRQWSNIVSCGFVAVLYAIMVLKPGFPVDPLTGK